MKRVTGFLMGLFIIYAWLTMLAAQDKSDATTPPPKVLTITREFLKPGRSVSIHEKSESAFVQAMSRAKWPTHYLALDSLSGRPRSLFLTGYDSFEAWEKDVQATEKNSALSAALDRAAMADGDLLSDIDMGAFRYSEEYSLRSAVDIPHMRYFEISVFHIRSGRHKEWDDLVKLVMAAYEKISDVHWATYEAVYGQMGSEYLVFTPLKSASGIDKEWAQDKQFEAALGEEGLKKLSELEAAAVESSQTNLFAFNPKMSYTSDEWVKADPDFWKPKSAGSAAPKKAEDKQEKK
jgi:hypothetical protein